MAYDPFYASSLRLRPMRPDEALQDAPDNVSPALTLTQPPPTTHQPPALAGLSSAPRSPVTPSSQAVFQPTLSEPKSPAQSGLSAVAAPDAAPTPASPADWTQRAWERLSALQERDRIARERNTGVLQDLGTRVMQGVARLPGQVAGLADIPIAAVTGKALVSDAADWIGDKTGFQPGQYAEKLNQKLSPAAMQAKAEIDQAWDQASSDDIGGSAAKVAGAYLSNPVQGIAGLVAESAPLMLAGGALGRAAAVGGKALQAGTGIGAKAGEQMVKYAPAIGEGGIAGGAAMDTMLDQGVDPRLAAGASAGTALTTGFFGHQGRLLAQKLGYADLEASMAGVAGQSARQPRLAERIAGGAAIEGLAEELPQSLTEQMWQNAATGRPMTEGLARAGVEGTLAGTVMGAGMNILPPTRKAIDDPTVPDPERAKAAADIAAQLAETDPDLVQAWNEAAVEAIAGRKPINQVFQGWMAGQRDAQPQPGVDPNAINQGGAGQNPSPPAAGPASEVGADAPVPVSGVPAAEQRPAPVAAGSTPLSAAAAQDGGQGAGAPVPPTGPLTLTGGQTDPAPRQPAGAKAQAALAALNPTDEAVIDAERARAQAAMAEYEAMQGASAPDDLSAQAARVTEQARSAREAAWAEEDRQRLLREQAAARAAARAPGAAPDAPSGQIADDPLTPDLIARAEAAGVSRAELETAAQNSRRYGGKPALIAKQLEALIADRAAQTAPISTPPATASTQEETPNGQATLPPDGTQSAQQGQNAIAAPEQEQTGLLDGPAPTSSTAEAGATGAAAPVAGRPAGDPAGAGAAVPAVDAARAAFQPTHELSDGTLARAMPEPNVYEDADGNEIEDRYAAPITPERLRAAGGLEAEVSPVPVGSDGRDAAHLSETTQAGADRQGMAAAPEIAPTDETLNVDQTPPIPPTTPTEIGNAPTAAPTPPAAQADAGAESAAADATVEGVAGARRQLARQSAQLRRQHYGDEHSGEPTPHDEAFAQAVLDRDAFALRGMNIIDRNMNPAMRQTFQQHTGITLPRTQAASWKAIRQWAGVSDAQDAARTAYDHAESARRQALRTLQRKLHDVPGGQDGIAEARAWTLQQIEAGYTAVGKNAQQQTVLYNPQNGEGFVLSGRKNPLARFSPLIQAEAQSAAAYRQFEASREADRQAAPTTKESLIDQPETAPLAARWDDLSAPEREAAVLAAGSWTNANGGLTRVGRQLAKKPWDKISAESRAKLEGVNQPAAETQAAQSESLPYQHQDGGIIASGESKYRALRQSAGNLPGIKEKFDDQGRYIGPQYVIVPKGEKYGRWYEADTFEQAKRILDKDSERRASNRAKAAAERDKYKDWDVQSLVSGIKNTIERGESFEKALELMRVDAHRNGTIKSAGSQAGTLKGLRDSGIKTLDDLRRAVMGEQQTANETPTAQPEPSAFDQNLAGLTGALRNKAAQDLAPERAPSAQADYGTHNTVFTQDAAAKAREILRRKLGQLNSGLDPEMLQAGITLAGYHIEAGARSFAAYTKAMVADLGEAARPYLRSWYEGARYHPGFEAAKDMTPAAEIDAGATLETETQPERNDEARPTATNDSPLDAGVSAEAAGVAPASGTGAGDSRPDGRDSGGRGDRDGSDTRTADVGRGDQGAPVVPLGSGAREPSAGNVRGAGSIAPEGGATPAGRRRKTPAGEVGGQRPDAGRAGSSVGVGASERASGHPGSAGRGTDGSGVAAERKGDLRATPDMLKRTGSWYDTAERNVEIIELATRITEAGRQATPAEQALLVRYTGFGAGEIRNNLFPSLPTWLQGKDPGQTVIFPNGVREFHKLKNAGRESTEANRWGALADRLVQLPVEMQKTLLRSTQYAHYTSPGVIQGIWKAMARFGFRSGALLEPGMGIGHFATLMPEEMRGHSHYTGVEFDGPTAMIAKLLLPNQNILRADYTKRKLPRDFYDAAIGNPPFAKTKITNDPEYAKLGLALHDYFFAKTIDRVRPGGLLAFVTSRHTMDKQNDKSRRYLAERADLLGAIRLPQTAFRENAGTDVVTDVLFLRKRMPGEEPAGASWLELSEIQTPEGPLAVNEYFADHPEMVLGETRIGGMNTTDAQGRRINALHPGDLVVVSYDADPGALEQKFAQAVESLPENVYSAMSASNAAALKRRAAVQDFDPKMQREGVLYLGDQGQILRVEFGVGVALSEANNLKPAEEAWLKDYIALRDLVQEARFAQLEETAWKPALRRLNQAYDAFVKKHGPVLDYRMQTRAGKDDEGNPVENTSRVFKNKRLLNLDYDAPLVMQLEQFKEDGSIVKGPFLKDRTVARPRLQTITSAADALAVSLDAMGALDLDDIASRIQMSREEVIDSLGNLVYRTPQGQWQLADEYLSGNVKAKLAEAQEAAKLDKAMQRNVAALEKVQPLPLSPAQITVQLGAGWVPAEYVSAFSTEILGAGVVTYDTRSETWTVAGGNLRKERNAAADWGTADRSPSEILEAVLNNRPIKITRTERDGNKTVTYTDKEATAAVNDLARKMKQQFKSWIWTDQARAAVIADTYNDRYNNIALRRFDGSHLTLPGVSLRFDLYPHQKRVIWRIIQTGNTYLAHAVGAGKTIEMIAAGMEQKRLGLIRKPMYVVPNHMLEQFSNEFMQLYPLANLLIADDVNFTKERRKQFVAATAMNNPDAVIITHSAFKRVGMKEESIAPFRDAIVREFREALDDTPTDHENRVRRSQLEQQLEAIEKRFDRILQKNQDALVQFEEMGVDFLVVDEAHNHRKLDFTTNRPVKGVDPNGSWQAMDLFIKTRWLESRNPGRSFVMASGTPVTNTMGELYSIHKFFNQAEMERDGFSTFDAWANMFGEVATDFERNAAGKIEAVERFAAFSNVPELMNRVRGFMDVLNSSQLGDLVKRPDLEGGKPNMVLVEPSETLTTFMRDVLEPRLQASKEWKPSKEQPNNPDPIIAIIGDARVASIDPRFIGGTVSEDQPSKLMVMGDKIAEDYKAGRDRVYLDREGKPEKVKGSTQIVFFNMGLGQQAQLNRGFNARKALTDRIVAGGVPRAAIAWFEDADTDAKKEAVFRDMRAGKIAVLIGSAKKMGTGVNVQNRLEVLHYLDPPWYPADVEQPHGRIIRQGNQNEQVRINWYSTKETYEATMWQMVARKQRFIDQALSGDAALRRIEDISEASQFEMAAALVSGDPRIIDLAHATRDAERYAMLQETHSVNQSQLRQKITWDGHRVEHLTGYLPKLAAASTLVKGHQTFQGAIIGSTAYDKRGEAGYALVESFNRAVQAWKPGRPKEIEIGTVNHGLVKISVVIETDKKGKLEGGRLRYAVGDISASGMAATSAEHAEDDGKYIARALDLANSLAGDLIRYKGELADLRQSLTAAQKKLGAPFEYAQELIEAQTKRARLEQELLSEGKAIPQDGSAADLAAISAMDSEGGGQAVRFNLTDQRPTGDRLTATFLQARLDALTARWPGLKQMPVKVVNSERQLPESVRAKLAEMRANGTKAIPRAVYVPGDGLYFVAGNIANTKEALLALAEEAIGHHGLRAVMGPQFEALLDRVLAERKADVQAMAADYGLDLNNRAQALEAAEEYLAHQARLDSKETWFQGIVQAIRQMLRKMGLNLRLSDGDIRALLAASNKYVTQGDARAALRARERFGGKATGRGQDARLSASAPRPANAGGDLDAEYFAALERGDMATVERMVREAAERAGVPLLPEDTNNVGYKARRTAPPKKTVKVYKAFRMRDGKLYPMFVGAADELPVGIWLDATEGGYHFTGDNGREYIPADTGVSIPIPNDAARAELLKRGYIKKPDAKSIKVVAYRPGWHGGELPFFPQAGNKVTHQGKKLIAGVPDDYAYPNVHEFDTVIAEVEMDADRDYKPEYIQTAERNADGSINKQKSGLRSIPSGGYYEYATNPLFADRPDLGKWFISGSVKINRILSQAEVNANLDKLDVPRQAWNAPKGGQFDTLDLNALGYDPQFNHVYHKLLDPVTYDDNGQVIPLSQRFDRANPDIRFSLAGARGIADLAEQIGDRIERFRTPSIQKIGLWDRTVGTPFNLAKRYPETFGKVYRALTDYMDRSSTMAMQAESLAPNFFTQMERGLIEAFRSGRNVAGAMNPKEAEGVQAALNEGTLAKVRYNEAALRARGLNDRQIASYNQALRAAHHSLDATAQTFQVQQLRALIEHLNAGQPKAVRRALAAKAKMILGGDDVTQAAEYAAVVTDSFLNRSRQDESDAQGRVDAAQQALKQAQDRQDREAVKRTKADLDAAKEDLATAEKTTQIITGTQQSIDQIAERVQQLKREAYFPLMRFGRFTLTVYQQDADSEEQSVVRYSQFASEDEMKAAADGVRAELGPDQTLVVGTKNEDAYKQFEGLNMDTLSLFADQLENGTPEGMKTAELMREYIRLATAETSALKRTLQRKGIAGYSTDAQRVLASFIVSNSRMAASNLHMGEIRQAIDAIPKEQGDLGQYAQRLQRYIQDPTEEMAGLRSFMFVWYLGGSVASAMTNLTQIPMVTLPYLTQFKGGSAKNVLAAYRQFFKGPPDENSDLGKAYKRAELDGLISPQGVYNLMATARGGTLGAGKILRHPGTQFGLTVWGSLFSMAEQMNRQVTFIAAYNQARARGETDASAYSFAEDAVQQTQFVYRKENRPQWSRGIAAPLFTFKMFTVSYLEMLARMPVKQKALMLAALVVAAGLTGLPGEDDAEDLIDTLMQWAGYNFQTRDELQKWAEQFLGETVGKMVLEGVSAGGLPFDLHSRLGMGNLIPGSGMLKPGKANDTREVTEIFGPAAGVLKDVGMAAEKLGRGEAGAAGYALMPRALKAFLDGYTGMTEGAMTDRTGKPLMDITATEAAFKLIGFQPRRVAEFQDKKYRLMARDAHRKDMESAYLDRLARAKVKGDASGAEKARLEIVAWNKRNPDDPIEYSRAQVRARMKALKMMSSERFLRALSPELRKEATAALR